MSASKSRVLVQYRVLRGIFEKTATTYRGAMRLFNAHKACDPKIMEESSRRELQDDGVGLFFLDGSKKVYVLLMVPKKANGAK